MAAQNLAAGNEGIPMTNSDMMMPAMPQQQTAEPEKPSSRQPSLDNDEDDGTPDDTESLDSNSSRKDTSPRNGKNFSRSVTMHTLVQEGVLEPGPGVLSIDYLGQKYCGDLLPSGKIFWENVQFASPSSWATYIKKKINPSKKSGCGWNSVKYKGKKLDKLKLNWFRKNSGNIAPGLSPASNCDEDFSSQTAPLILDNKMVRERKAIKHSEIKLQAALDPNTIVEFEQFNDNQPFSVVISTSVLLLIDFHCHLTTSEVAGYLGGRWNPNDNCLYIMQALPCKCKLCDQESAIVVEQEISNTLAAQQLSRVGWYHSHPTSQAEPTLRDIDVQYELQCNNMSHPTVAFINAPFDVRDATRSESVYSAFWVASPPEGSPEQAYGVPMQIKYTESMDQTIHADILHEMRQMVEYYKQQPDLILFTKLWRGTMTYLDKVKLSMTAKLPKDKTGAQLIQFVQEILTKASQPGNAT